MDIPPKVSIPICIEQGSIYHYQINKTNKDGTEYSGSRFFIVINKNPKTDGVIVLTTITTKTKETKKFIKKICEDEDTIVPIKISDFPNLSQDSIVNCNNYYSIQLEKLIEKIENGGKIFTHQLPKTVINALINGIMKSNQIPTEVKEILI